MAAGESADDVQELDAIMNNKYARQPEKLRAWQSANQGRARPAVEYKSCERHHSAQAESVATCYTATMPALDYPHIIKANGEFARFERLPRIRVAQIAADHIGNGWSAEEIIRQYPHLTAAEVHAALAYYYDHREAIDAELAAEVAALDAADQQAPTALRLRLLSIRRAAMA